MRFANAEQRNGIDQKIAATNNALESGIIMRCNCVKYCAWHGFGMHIPIFILSCTPMTSVSENVNAFRINNMCISDQNQQQNEIGFILRCVIDFDGISHEDGWLKCRVDMIKIVNGSFLVLMILLMMEKRAKKILSHRTINMRARCSSMCRS